MADDNVGKYTGDGVIDATKHKDELVDYKGGDMQGFRRSKPGLSVVLGEIDAAMPKHGDEARIHPSTYTEISRIVTLLAWISDLRPRVDKLAEVLRESQVYYEDKLETLISRLGKNVIDTAKDDNKPSLLAIFEKTLSYRALYADKAAATRRKNEQEATEGGGAENEPPPR